MANFIDNTRECIQGFAPNNVIITPESVGVKEYERIQFLSQFCSNIYYYQVTAWNILLALVPVVLSLNLAPVWRKKYWWKWIFLIILIIFIPNSLYLFSNFIDFTTLNQLLIPRLIFGVTANQFSFIVLFLVGSICFFVCTKKIFDLFQLPTSGKLAYFIVTGLAIYLGEFGRFNSWQIVDVVSIFRFIFDSNKVHLFQYCTFWSVVALVCYCFHKAFWGKFLSILNRN